MVVFHYHYQTSLVYFYFRFIPDLDDIVVFGDLCKEAGLSETCNAAAQQLDQVISNMIQNFTEGTEYFKVRPPSLLHFINYFSNVFSFPRIFIFKAKLLFILASC